jgi:hypothetical protein
MSKFNFQQVRKNIGAMKRDLPRLLANDAQNYFLSSFRNQGWNGNPWEDVQRRIEGTPAFRYPKHKGLTRRTLPILQGRTGKLRREVSNLAGRAIINYAAFNFTVTLKINASVVPYAHYINKGTPRMVARRYMGDAPPLRRRLRNRITRYLDRSFKSAA